MLVFTHYCCLALADQLYQRGRHHPQLLVSSTTHAINNGASATTTHGMSINSQVSITSLARGVYIEDVHVPPDPSAADWTPHALHNITYSIVAWGKGDRAKSLKGAIPPSPKAT
jgi:hypothetical protein